MVLTEEEVPTSEVGVEGPSEAAWLLEQTRHRDQPPVDGIRDQPKTPQSKHAKERFRANSVKDGSGNSGGSAARQEGRGVRGCSGRKEG